MVASGRRTAGFRGSSHEARRTLGGELRTEDKESFLAYPEFDVEMDRICLMSTLETERRAAAHRSRGLTRADEQPNMIDFDSNPTDNRFAYEQSDPQNGTLWVETRRVTRLCSFRAME